MEDVQTGNGWKEDSVDQFDKGEYCPWPNTPAPENERQLPGDSQQQRQIRVEKQRAMEAEAKQSQANRVPKRNSESGLVLRFQVKTSRELEVRSEVAQEHG